MLYFVYGARLDPARLAEAAPGAGFVRIAHLPETRLSFPVDRPDLGGSLPSLTPDPGHSVWGALFEIPPAERAAFDAAEAAEGRAPTTRFRAVDREGAAYEVVTHTAIAEGPDGPPSPTYLEAVVAGARHWALPAGWVVGLEDLAEDSLL